MTKTLLFPTRGRNWAAACSLHRQSAAAGYVLFQSLTHGVDTNFGLVNFKQLPIRSSASVLIASDLFSGGTSGKSSCDIDDQSVMFKIQEQLYECQRHGNEK